MHAASDLPCEAGELASGGLAIEQNGFSNSRTDRLSIAIVHDQLYTIGGAENVLKVLCRMFPNAEVFSLYNVLSAESLKSVTGGREPKTTFMQRLPMVARLRKFYFFLMPFAVEQLDLRAYRLVISSSYLVAKGVITGPQQIHLCYMHSPMRSAWDQQISFLEAIRSRFGVRRLLVRVLLHYMRIWDASSTHRVDHLIVNSRYVARRAMKAYGRSAEIIYPPLPLEHFRLQTAQREPDLFVTVSRLAEGKRIDILLAAFAQLPDCRLLIVGEGALRRQLEATAPPNVAFLGWLPQSEVVALLGRASAFVYSAEEDFGIAPVEAQACGTPVIAYAVGGTAETVRNLAQYPTAPTGVLFHQQTAAGIAEAVELFRTHRADFRPDTCRENAERFEEPRFEEAFRRTVTTLLAGHLPQRTGE